MAEERYRRKIVGMVGPMVGRSGDAFVSLFAAGRSKFAVVAVYDNYWHRLKEVSEEAFAVTQRPPIPNKMIPNDVDTEKASGLYVSLETPFDVTIVRWPKPDGKHSSRIDWDDAGSKPSGFNADAVVGLGMKYLGVFVRVYNAAKESMPDLDSNAVSEVVRSIMWATEWKPDEDAKSEDAQPAYPVLGDGVSEDDWLHTLSEVTGISRSRLLSLAEKMGTSDRDAVSFVAVAWKNMTDLGMDRNKAFEIARMTGLTMLAEKSNKDSQ